MRHPFSADVFTARRLKIGASVGAIGLCAALIGATAAPAATHPASTVQPAAHGVLQIRFAAPEPLVLPSAPAEGMRLAVLADPPVNLGFDPDLQGVRDLAIIREAEGVQAHNAQVQATLWARDEARLQAQIDAAAAPIASVPSAADTAAAARPAGDAEITASAGDTRRPSSVVTAQP